MLTVKYLKQNNFCLFKPSDNFTGETIVEPEEKIIEEDSFEEVIYCKLCLNIITSHSEKIITDGKFLHEFINPAHIKYIIGCFLNASGSVVQGVPTLEATWFSEHEWSFVNCKKCTEHLGWYFQKENNGFYGLIISKLEGGL